MPACHRQHDSAFEGFSLAGFYVALKLAPEPVIVGDLVKADIALKTGVSGRCIPAPYLLADRLAVGFLAVLDRIVDPEEMRAAARGGRTDADCEVHSALIGVPAVGSLRICGQSDIEQRAIFGRSNKPANLTPKISRKIVVITCGDDAFLGVTPKKIRWKPA